MVLARATKMVIFCYSFLLITNTIFHLTKHHKTSWRHPRSNHYHFIDYVIVRSSSRKDAKMTRSFSIGDHRLIRSKVIFTIRSPVRNNWKTPCDSKLTYIPDSADIESKGVCSKVLYNKLWEKNLTCHDICKQVGEGNGTEFQWLYWATKECECYI